MKIKNRIIDFFVLTFVGFAMIMLLVFPEKMATGIADGLMLCGNVLIPSLFSFTVLSVFLFECSIIQKRIKSLFVFSMIVFLLSLLGGYPIGAKIISNARKNDIIDGECAENLLTFCVNAGPAFILTVVGSNVFANKKIGVLLLTAHVTSSIEILLLNKKKMSKKKISYKQEKVTLSEAFVNSVASSCSAMISICSFVILFSGIINLISTKENINKYIISFLEITNAVLINKNIYFVSFFLGFSGLCVIMQILSIGNHFITKPHKIIFSRILHGLLSVVNLKILLLIFPLDVQVLSNNINFSYKTLTTNTIGGLLLIFLAITFITSIESKKYNGKIIKDIW